MKIAIHQPNFFPYYPIFQKMEQVDVFVIMSHCQFEKNNYQNRFNIGNDWYTLSVNKGLQAINNKTYVYPEKDWNIIKMKLKKYRDILNEFDECICPNLALTNAHIIFKIADMLEIDSRIQIREDFETVKKGTDRLIEICQYYGADTYLSGISGKTYLELDKFKQKNIEVVFQEPELMIRKPIIEILSEKSCLIKL